MKEYKTYIIKTASSFLVSWASTKLALVMGGGPPSLFWPTNGVITIFMIYSSDFLTYLTILSTGGLAMAVAQSHITDIYVGMRLATGSIAEIVTSTILMEYYRPILSNVNTFKFVSVLFFCVSSFNCVIGATIGALTITSVFPGSVFLDDWVDWFIGDITGNFIVIYTWYIMSDSVRNSGIRKFEDVKTIISVFFSVTNVVGTTITLASIGLTTLAYCVNFSSSTMGIPFLMLTTPVISALGLSFSPFLVGLIDTILVLLVIIGTRKELGPIFIVFRTLSQRDVFIGVQLTLLFTYILSAVLSVVRHKNITRENILEKTIRDRVAFFSHVSHELRTPLSVITGYTESILNHEEVSDIVREDLKNIMEASLTMTTTVTDLLMVFRSEGHTLEIEKSSINMKEFSSGILSLVTQLSESKNIEIELNVCENMPTTILTDPRRVRQVMINIVGNAIKYTRRGGNVKVNVSFLEEEGKKALRVSTVDTGLGIKEEDIPHLFTRFFRSENTIEEQGTGLGLTICQEILNSMGGSITVESVYGIGSTFTFHVPVTTPDIESTSEEVIFQKTFSSSEEENHFHALVVEDSMLNLKLLVRILERYGYDVDSVMDGVSAVEAIFTGKYDVVLLDLGLPLKPGIEVIMDVRHCQWDKVRDVPIIVTSGNVEEKTREECLKEGCSGFADKPFREREIKNIITNVIKKA